MAASFYTAAVSTDGSGDGTNLNSQFNPVWNGKFNGALVGILVDNNGADATVDVTISEPNGLKRTILTATNVASDTNYNPQRQIQDNTGTNTGLYTPYFVDSANLKVTVAQGGTSITNAIKVVVLILET